MGNENLSYGTGMKYLEHQSKDISTVSAEAIAENMFQAIDTIVSKRLESLPYNTTKICMVIDDTHKDLGIYRVTDNTATFIAYSDSTEYKVDDRVRVSIENNDTTQKKYIIGRYSSNDINSLITAASPLDEIIIVNPGILTYTGLPKGLTANNKYQYEATLGHITGKFNETQICNTLYIKANFQSNLGNYDMRSGEYGIRLLITNNRGETREAYLTSKDMLGDPYTLLTPSTQSAIFDISDFGIITDIKAWFYQNNNFAYWNGEEVQLFGDDELNLNIKNLLVSDVEVGLAIGNLHEIADNTLQLYTSGDLEYSGANTNTADNLRDISLIWYNKSGANSYLGFTDGIHDLLYDEYEYLDKLDKFNELKAETVKDVPNDLVGLRISKNTTKILSAMDIIIEDYFDRRGYFDDLFDKFKDSPDMEVFFNSDKTNKDLIKEFDNLRASYVAPLQTIRENASKYYTDMLAEAKYLQDYGRFRKENIKDYINVSINENVYLDIDETLNKTINKFFVGEEATEDKPKVKGLNDLIAELEEKVKNEAYKKTTTEFINAINDIKSNLYTLISNEIDKSYSDTYGTKKNYKLDDFLADFFAVDENLSPTYKFNKFDEEFPYEDYENRYCIYWYQYDSEYTNDVPYEKNFLRKLGLNWRRMEVEQNKGLPHDVGKMERVNKDKTIYYYPSLPTNDEATIRHISLSPNKKKESFLAVIFYNHDIFYSNVLEFYNKFYINESVDLNNQAAVSIENSTGSRDLYNVYDENNVLISDKDIGTKYVTLNYMGTDGSGYEKLSGAKVAWYIPSEDSSTQLEIDLEEIEESGFGSDIGENISATTDSIDGYACFSKVLPTLNEAPTEDEIKEFKKSLRFPYKIKSFYDSTNNNNTIVCKVIVGGYTYQPRKSFAFSSYGNNGTDYTFTLTKSVDNEQELYSEAVSDGVDNRLILDVKLLGPTGEIIDVHYNSSGPSLQNPEVSVSGLKNYNIIPYDRESENGLQSPYIIKFYNKSHDDLSSLTNIEDDVVKTIEIIKPIAKDFENEKYKDILTGTDKETIDFEDKRYCGVLQLEMNLRIPNASSGYDLVELDYTYPITYLKDRKYKIVGASNIIYNSYGTNPSYEKINYSLSGFDENEIDANLLWKVVAFPRRNASEEIIDFSKLTYKPSIQGSTLIVPNLYSESDYIYMVQCLGKPKEKEEDFVPDHNETPIDPPDDTELPEVPFDDEEQTPEETPKEEENSSNKYTTLLGVRPLNIVMNTYAVPTINKWNGRGVSITDDDGKGKSSVLSTVVAAGSKTANNQFSGVVLGNVSESNDDTLGIPGLYGFNEGVQTFGFKNNGTGFIGNAAGRIEFDGRTTGEIFSTGREMVISLGNRTITMADKTEEEIENSDENAVVGKIVISALPGTTYPLSIGKHNKNDEFTTGFRVDWDGTIIANSSLNISGSTVEGLSVTSGMITNGAVTSDALSVDAVLTSKIVNNAVTSNKLADDAVTTSKIANDAVTESKIANDAVTSAKIKDGSIGTNKLADDAVTSAKIADGAIKTALIASDAITANLLPNNIPISKIIIQRENNDSISLTELLTSYENRIKELEDKLAEEAFTNSIEDILRAHNLIT